MTESVTDFKVSLMEPKPLSWWRSRRSKIDMDPPYQRRGRLWSAADKAYLIDSILNGYDVPKFYVGDFTWGESTLNRKKLPYAIIDGKQRFEAIFDFFDGVVALNDDFVLLSQPSLKLGGLGYKDLQENYPEIAELFDTYPPTVMAVVAKSEGPINELFVRLNRSKSLTGAEVRNAMTGPAPEIIRQISRHEFFRSNVSFPFQRGQDLNAAGKLLLFEYLGGPQETKKRNLDAFVRQAAKGAKDKLELAGRRVIDTLDEMASIFLPGDKLLAAGGIVPVYYWFIRKLTQSDYHKVREFLVLFENRRRENRELIKVGSSKLTNQSLTDFDAFNRSTNDLGSHLGRVAILSDAFREWKKPSRPKARAKVVKKVTL